MRESLLLEPFPPPEDNTAILSTLPCNLHGNLNAENQELLEEEIIARTCVLVNQLTRGHITT